MADGLEVCVGIIDGTERIGCCWKYLEIAQTLVVGQVPAFSQSVAGWVLLKKRVFVEQSNRNANRK